MEMSDKRRAARAKGKVYKLLVRVAIIFCITDGCPDKKTGA